jgi:DNA-binding transcriptional LysR family regulator
LSRKSKASPGQQKLGRAQSNITTRIQQLEEELDVELFVRGNKNGALLLPEQFLDYALRILSLGEEAKQALHPTNPPGACAWGRWKRPPPAGLFTFFHGFARSVRRSS